MVVGSDIAVGIQEESRTISFPPVCFTFLLGGTKDTGSEVFAMGYPMADIMGSEVKFTDGKISSKSGIGGDVRVYQISVPIQPGNSGGPLFDMGGTEVSPFTSGLSSTFCAMPLNATVIMDRMNSLFFMFC
mgnify:CR=1 FL=1